MAGWAWVIVPAMVAALVTRIDSRIIGPYFSFGGLVGGWEGLDADFWYEKGTLRNAIVRRLAYPLVVGVGLALFNVDFWSVLAAGVLVAVLLIWPAAFVELPHGVRRADWKLWAVYTVMPVLYGALAVVGYFGVDAVRSASDGGVSEYVSEKLLDWVVTVVITAVLLAFWRGLVAKFRQQSRDSAPRWDEEVWDAKE